MITGVTYHVQSTQATSHSVRRSRSRQHHRQPTSATGVQEESGRSTSQEQGHGHLPQGNVRDRTTHPPRQRNRRAVAVGGFGTSSGGGSDFVRGHAHRRTWVFRYPQEDR